MRAEAPPELLGFKKVYVDDPREVAAAWNEALAAHVPVVVEFKTDPETPPHIGFEHMRKCSLHGRGAPLPVRPLPVRWLHKPAGRVACSKESPLESIWFHVALGLGGAALRPEESLRPFLEQAYGLGGDQTPRRGPAGCTAGCLLRRYGLVPISPAPKAPSR